MHIPPWFWYVLIILVSWGIVGLFQKLSTNCMSAESAFLWLAVGFLIPAPLLYSRTIFDYPPRYLTLGIICGAVNVLGAWALLAAMRHGGKASIVVPLTALYPLVVVLLAPFVLHESLTGWQGAGVACALVAVILLSL